MLVHSEYYYFVVENVMCSMNLFGHHSLCSDTIITYVYAFTPVGGLSPIIFIINPKATSIMRYLDKKGYQYMHQGFTIHVR